LKAYVVPSEAHQRGYGAEQEIMRIRENSQRSGFGFGLKV
jgi:hypothetical protein